MGNADLGCLINKQTQKRMGTAADIRRLYEQHRAEMLRLACRLLADEEEGRDAVSDVFAQLAEREAEMRCDAAYLFSAVRNRCMNVLRHKSVQERVHRLLPLDDAMAEDSRTAEERERKLESILRFVDTELTPQTRQVVHLRFRERMTYAQIARHLGISEAAVYKHLAQAIRKLKQRFNP